MTSPLINDLTDYLKSIESNFNDGLSVASNSRSKGYDPTLHVEVQIVRPDYYNILNKPTSELGNIDNYSISILNFYKSALLMSINEAKKTFGFIEPIDDYINRTLKYGLNLITNDQQIYEAEIVNFSVEKDQYGNEYFVITFNQATHYLTSYQIIFILLLGNELRKIIGLGKTISKYDDILINLIIKKIMYTEAIGELRYETDNSKITTILQNLPIYLVEKPNRIMNETEVGIDRFNHYDVDLAKIINDIVLNKSRFLLRLAHSVDITDWDWISLFSNSPYKRNQNYIKKAITLTESTEGAFRLVCGKSQNMSVDTIGIHPSIVELFNTVLTPGSLVFVSGLGYFTVSIVDTLEPPLIKLTSGSVIYARTPQTIRQLRDQVEKIIQFGEILIPPVRVMLQEKSIPQSTYSLNEWFYELKDNLSKVSINHDLDSQLNLNDLVNCMKNPESIKLSFEQALLISKSLDIPLIPKYNLSWNSIKINELDSLIEKISYNKNNVFNDSMILPASEETISILEKLGVEFLLEENKLIIKKPYCEILITLSNLKHKDQSSINLTNTLDYVKSIFGCKINDKDGHDVGLSVIIQKDILAQQKKTLPHVLFPIKNKSGNINDIISYCKMPYPQEFRLRKCSDCNRLSPYLTCPFCEGRSIEVYFCIKCKTYQQDVECKTCGNTTEKTHNEIIDWKVIMENAIQKVQVQPYAPLRGVNRSKWNLQFTERLEKGILRQRNNLVVARDGTVKFTIINSPLLAFSPKQIATDVNTLRDLGYNKDINGELLEREDQFIPIKPQDVVIPFYLADQLRKVADYIDEILVKIYGVSPYYNIKTLNDLIGKLIVGQSQRRTFGLLGRIIGFTEANVCFAHPIWHENKGSNCRGRSDYVMLLLDSLINFSNKYTESATPDKIGTLQSLRTFVTPHLIHTLQMVDLIYSLNLNFMNENTVKENLESVRNNTDSILNVVPPITTFSSTLTGGQNRSTTTEMSDLDIINAQIKIARISSSMNLQQISYNLLMRRLIPLTSNIIKNYTSQRFRCKNCGRNYRRLTLRGLCLFCEKKLQPTYTSGYVEKYVETMDILASNVTDSSVHEIVKLIKDNFDLLFYGRKQTTLSDYT